MIWKTSCEHWHLQTPRKLFGFYRTEDKFWPDFADIKHDYTQEFYRSYSSFISQCPRTGKFRVVCIYICHNSQFLYAYLNTTQNKVHITDVTHHQKMLITKQEVTWYCSKLHSVSQTCSNNRMSSINFCVNTLRPRQNGHNFPDDIFKCIFLNESICISLKIWLHSFPKFRINNNPALVQIMAWHRPGDKPLSEPMMV